MKLLYTGSIAQQTVQHHIVFFFKKNMYKAIFSWPFETYIVYYVSLFTVPFFPAFTGKLQSFLAW